MPTRRIAAINSAVATGLRMKGADGLKEQRSQRCFPEWVWRKQQLWRCPATCQNCCWRARRRERGRSPRWFPRRSRLVEGGASFYGARGGINLIVEGEQGAFSNLLEFQMIEGIHCEFRVFAQTLLD